MKLLGVKMQFPSTRKSIYYLVAIYDYEGLISIFNELALRVRTNIVRFVVDVPNQIIGYASDNPNSFVTLC